VAGAGDGVTASTTIAARGAEFGSAAIVHPASGITRDPRTMLAIPDTAGTGTITHQTIGHRTPPSGRFIVRPRTIRETQATAHPPIARPAIARRPITPVIVRRQITPVIVRRPTIPEIVRRPINPEMEIVRALRTIDQIQGHHRTDLNPDRPDQAPGRPLLQNLHHRPGPRRKTGLQHNRPDQPRRTSQRHHRTGPRRNLSQRTPEGIAEVKEVKGKDSPGEGATRIRANTS